MNKRIVRIVSTFFGVGLIPIISGTWGSLAGLLIYFFLLKENLSLHLLFFFIITVLGILVCKPAEEIFKKKDAGAIVIDEVAGILGSFLFIPSKPLYLIIGFFLFRLYDAIKPPPADILEKFPGSLGVMGDDLIAGLYCNISLHAIHFTLGYMGL